MSSFLYLKYYRKYRDKIYTYFLYRVNFDTETAEDLTADVFTKALDKFDTYNKDKPFQAWIYAIAHNHLVNHYKAQKQTVDIKDVEHKLVADEDVTEIVEERLQMDVVMAHIELLPIQYKNIILLKYVEDLSHDEIADMLGKRAGAVRTSLSRAMTALRKSIQEQSDLTQEYAQ